MNAPQYSNHMLWLYEDARLQITGFSVLKKSKGIITMQGWQQKHTSVYAGEAGEVLWWLKWTRSLCCSPLKYKLHESRFCWLTEDSHVCGGGYC